MFQITSSSSPFKIKHEWLHIATHNFRILSLVTPNSVSSVAVLRPQCHKIPGIPTNAHL